jgi:hypothetical protein
LPAHIFLREFERTVCRATNGKCEANAPIKLMNHRLNLLAVVAALAIGAQSFGQPVIIAQLKSQTNLLGSMVTLAVEASGTPPLSYQWRRSSNLDGKTNTTLIFTNLQSADAGNYTVVITNSEGAVTSAVAFVRVLIRAGHFCPTTNNLVIDVGSTANFGITATGTTPFRYQWQLNEISLPDGTNSTLSLPNVQRTNAGRYRVVVTNAAGTIISQTVTLTVLPIPHGFSAITPTSGGALSFDSNGRGRKRSSNPTTTYTSWNPPRNLTDWEPRRDTCAKQMLRQIS